MNRLELAVLTAVVSRKWVHSKDRCHGPSRGML